MDSKRIELCDSDTEKIMELSDDMIFYIKGEKEMLRLCANGDIFVKEHLVENDKEVVDGMRNFLKEVEILEEN